MDKVGQDYLKNLMKETALLHVESLPQHIAIIMDGNGRWAKQRKLPRIAGHHAGVEALRKAVDYCIDNGIRVLTLFAFSSENWRRPPKEVRLLMDLFSLVLTRETAKLLKKGVCLKFIGNRSALSSRLQSKISESEEVTKHGACLTLVIAADYGGRWDIAQAFRKLAESVERGELKASEISEEDFQSHLSFSDLPDPDLFIRTGGEKRISNFMLWQLAYTELYFTPALWPDFDEKAFQRAIDDYAGRERRFGHTGDQIVSKAG